jgi:hypothetical protein
MAASCAVSCRRLRRGSLLRPGLDSLDAWYLPCLWRGLRGVGRFSSSLCSGCRAPSALSHILLQHWQRELPVEAQKGREESKAACAPQRLRGVSHMSKASRGIKRHQESRDQGKQLMGAMPVATVSQTRSYCPSGHRGWHATTRCMARHGKTGQHAVAWICTAIMGPQLQDHLGRPLLDHINHFCNEIQSMLPWYTMLTWYLHHQAKQAL